MTVLITRRMALLGSLVAVPALPSFQAKGQDALHGAAKAQLAELERQHGGRLGVAVIDTGSGKRIEHRAGERFAMCSTFKFLAAAYILARVDRKEESLDRQVVFSKEDIVTWSPVTEKRIGGEGMTMAEICEAAITQSDNTAGNLQLASFGGPAGLTAFARALGDNQSRLDRWEIELNEAKTGDPRDTTTPAAMLENMHKILLGNALSRPSRDQLIAWLVANKTGGKRFRSVLPEDWRIGDKTGTGANGAMNDIATIWPPGRKPILVAGYYTESHASDDQRNGVLAEVGRIAAAI